MRRAAGRVRSKDVAHVIPVGGGGASPSRQQAWSCGNDPRHGGVSGSLPDAARSTGTGAMNTAGLFPEGDDDPLPVLRQPRQPLPGIWGAHDRRYLRSADFRRP